MMLLFLRNFSGTHLMCAQLCPTLCDPMNDSLPGSTLHGILQVRILEWVAIFYSKRSSQPRNWTHVSCIGRQILYHWATWEAQVGSRACCKSIWHSFSPNTSHSPHCISGHEKVFFTCQTSLVAQTVKHLPTMQETWVRSLGWEDPLEKEMATQLHYSCLENPMHRGAW